MLSLWGLEHLDVVEQILPGFDTNCVGSAPNPFPLEQIEEALGDRVVVAVPKTVGYGSGQKWTVSVLRQ